jgi:CRP/FNR family transcriptional regulator, cyclic AMP receptor protein
MALSHVPLFAGLSDRDLETLSGTLSRHRYARNEIILVAGRSDPDLCIIERGSVRIVLTSEDGREVVLAILGVGEFFGELELLGGTAGSADVVAQDDCSLLRLKREHFRAFLRTHPDTAEQLLAVMSQRLRETDTLVYDTAFRDVPSRLARIIFRLAASHGRREPDGIVLGRRLTQEELAAMIGSSRVSVNKCLKAWQRQGLVTNLSGVVKVLRPADLWDQSDLGHPIPPDVSVLF